MLNATVVGTLTVDDDFIVSGFGYSNYMTVSDITYTPQTDDVIELNLRYKCTAYYNWGVVLIGWGTSAYDNPEFKDSSTSGFYNSNGFEWGTNNVSHQLGNWYRVKMTTYYKIGSSTQIKFAFSDDEGNTWQEYTFTGTISSASKFKLNDMMIGNCIENRNQYLRGYVDMRNTNIKVNNQIIWQGVI